MARRQLIESGECGGTSCDVNECVILGRLASSGLQPYNLEIAGALLSIGSEPKHRIDFHTPIPPGVTKSAHENHFYKMLNYFRRVEVLSGIIVTSGGNSNRLYRVDNDAKQAACAAILEDPELIPEYKARTIDNVIEVAFGDRSDVDAFKDAIAGWLTTGDRTDMSVVIAACSPLQITSALAVAKKQILHSDGYQDDVAIRQRLAQISRISTDDDGNTSRQSVLEFFAPHQPDGDQDEESSIDWRDKGLCSGSDQRMFFPERGESALPAKKVCYGCEFREPCAEVAIERGEKFGVWGGLSERERRRIRSQRARARRQDVTEIPVAIAE